MSREKVFNIFRTLVAVLAAIMVAIITIMLVSETPVESLKLFFIKPFSSLNYFGNVLEMAIPLIFAGLSMCLLFQASLFNLASEGIFFAGGLFASLVGVYVLMPTGLSQIVVILVGGFVGMLVMIIPAVLKAKLNANELLVSLMINSILAGICTYLVTVVFNDTSTAVNALIPFADSVKLPKIIEGTRVHLGLIIALAYAAVLYIYLYKTKWGYEIRMVGMNQKFAKYSGINIVKVIIVTHLIAGFVAGSGAAIENIGIHNRFEWSALPGYGFSGALIAILANNNPIGAVFSSLFIAYLSTGASLASRLADVPAELQVVLQGVIFLLISMQNFMQGSKRKWLAKGRKEV